MDPAQERTAHAPEATTYPAILYVVKAAWTANGTERAFLTHTHTHTHTHTDTYTANTWKMVWSRAATSADIYLSLWLLTLAFPHYEAGNRHCGHDTPSG